MDMPFPRSYWVEKGRFMAGFNPGTRKYEQHLTGREKLNALLDCGIRSLVNLMQEGEYHYTVPLVRYVVPNYEADWLKYAADKGLDTRFARFPIRDMALPTVEQMAALLDHIDAEIAAERPVYVHCQGGIGRTGTTVGCWLIRHGKANSDNVFDVIGRLRAHIDDGRGFPAQSPETKAQRRFVVEWQQGQ